MIVAHRYLQRHKNQDVMGNAWFIAEWIRCVLVHGFGFKFADDPSAKPEDDLSFRPYGVTKNAELTWTPGNAVLFANKPPGADDYNLVSTPGLDAITTAHRQKLIDAMRAKAVRQEELLWTTSPWLQLRKPIRSPGKR